MKITLQNIIITLGLLLIPIVNFAQSPNLGTATDFVLFSSVGAITNVGTTDPAKYLTKLTGNVGANSGSITGFGNVNGVMHNGDGASNTCAADLLLAYNFLNASIPDSTIMDPVLGNDSTITAGTYLLPGAYSLESNLILDAKGDPNAVFIFKMPAGPPVFAFSANANSKIILKNGAKACNVFWLISGAVNMSTAVFMRGTIISGGAIVMAANDTLEGRALTINGAITIDNGNVGFLGYTPTGCGNIILSGPKAPIFYASKSFAIFSSIGAVSDDNFSHIIGDVGGNTVAPINYNPLFVTGGIYGMNGITAAAAADLTKVYDTLNTARPEDIILTAPTLFGHNLVLTPHTYLMNAAVTFTDTLYLDALGNADAVFIIKTNGAFATSVNSNVVLINGAQAKNVYWLVNGAISITANSTFNGTIVSAGGAIDILSGSIFNGRALATNGAISTASIQATIQPQGSLVVPINQIACVGDSIAFVVKSSGAGITYKWRKENIDLIESASVIGTTNDTLIINPVSISDSSSYYNVIVFDPFLPNDTIKNIKLHVNIAPNITIQPVNTMICNGDSARFVVRAIGDSLTYQWRKGILDLSNSPTIAGATTDTVTLYLTNIASEALNYNVVVTGYCLPISISNNASLQIKPLIGATSFTLGATTICQNAVDELYTATAANSTSIAYSVLPITAGTINSTTGVMNWNAIFNGTATITALSSGCGTSTADRVVTVTPLIGATSFTLGATTICQNAVDELYTATAANSTSIVYSVLPITAGTINATTGVINWNATFNGTATITALSTGCGTSTADRVVTVTPLIGATSFTLGATTICQNAADELYTATAANSTSIVYSVLPITAGAINATTGVINWDAGFNATATITALSSGCGTSTADRIVLVNLPIGATSFSLGATTLCENASDELYTATAANSTSIAYSVLPITAGTINSTTGVVNWNATFNGTATITALSSGCGTSTADRVVTVTPLIGATSFSLGATTICQNAADELYTATAANSTSIVYSVLPITAGTIDATTGVMNWNGTFNGTATITAFSSGCGTSTADRIVTVYPLIGATSFTDGATTLCEDAVDEIYSAIAANSTSIAYSVLPITAGTIDATTGVMNWNATFNGTATIIALSSGCGTSTAERVVMVNLPIGATNFTLGATTLCENTVDEMYTATAANSNSIVYSVLPITAGTIDASTGVMNWIAPFNGTATITAVSTGCGTSTADRLVTVKPIPIANAISNSTICTDSTILLIGQVVVGATYHWTNLTGYSSNLQSPTIPNALITDSGLYSLIVTNNGCESLPATVSVLVINCDTIEFKVPEGFSPNNDGINDVFFIIGINKYSNNKIQIFNRWGDRIYTKNNYQNTWDGFSTMGFGIGNKELPVGTYFYVLDLGDGSKIIKGAIYLIR